MTRRSAAALFLVLMGTTAHAASFDCRKAQRPVEKTICSNTALNIADEAQGQLYRDVLARLSSDSVGVVRADQVQWLAWVQQICPAAVGDEMRASACMLPLYRQRNRLLRTAIVRYDGVLFYTRSQYFAVAEERPGYKQSGRYPGVGTLEAQWPRADSVDSLWQAWNRQVEIRALLMANAREYDASNKTPLRPPVWSSDLAVRRNTQMTALLKRVEHGRVTAALTGETMERPSAHPSDLFEANIWLLAEQRPLQVRDVFGPGDGWRHIVAAAAYHALTSGEMKAYLFSEIDGPDAKPLNGVIGDAHNWTLEEDGLHISFPQYSVTPRLAHPDDAVVPWTTLKPVLAQGFMQP